AVELLFEEFEAVCKFPAGHLKHGRKGLLPIQIEDSGEVLVETLENISQQFSLKLNDVFRAIYEAEFKIKGIIFGQVPAGSVGFGSINVTGFKDPFESGHSVLLVELRTLGQICDAVKILDLKQIRSALGAGGHQLRG